jgi:dienelactone hydrolase
MAFSSITTIRNGAGMSLAHALSIFLIAQVPPADEARPFSSAFAAETARISPLAGITTNDEWFAQRSELKRRLLEMLGLWPFPRKTELAAEIRGTVEHPEFTVERILFQSSPGLYITANLYRPRTVTDPLPAILYVCGHARVEEDGVILGNKTHYQHHAAWFAANGYVCLVLDSLQLGEVPGLHHGTYNERLWWWQARGYTPAGIEAWNAIRGIDYLVSRPEVDPARLGMTGRSGGGATSWWLGAIDDRLAAVAPVAGITDLSNHVVAGDPGGRGRHGVVEGHCDCMYIHNTYRWDYDVVAALVAPTPLLLENTDKDVIFPADGVRRIAGQLQKVYTWYGVPDRLQVVVGTGGHVDSPELRHAAFRFFETWLKGKPESSEPIVEPDRTIPRGSLKVLARGEELPDSTNRTIDERFVTPAPAPSLPQSAEAAQALVQRWNAALRAKTFAGWPEESAAHGRSLRLLEDTTNDGIRLRHYEFESQPGVLLPLWLFTQADRPADRLGVYVCDADSWATHAAPLIDLLPREHLDKTRFPRYQALIDTVAAGFAQAIVAPRGVGSTAWPPERDTHTRRRFTLLGQTLDGMRVWDVRRAINELAATPDLSSCPIWLTAERAAGPVAAFAAVYEPEVAGVVLVEPSAEPHAMPPLLNLERIAPFPCLLTLLAPRALQIRTLDAAPWDWTASFGRQLTGESWPEIIQLPK